MAIATGLSTALSGLQANQTALDVTSNNISNASNPDYVRERAVFTTLKPINSIPGNIGMGVKISSVNRITDTFLFDRYTSSSATLKQLDTTEQYLKEIGTYFPDVQDQGLHKNIADFFNAWQNFASNPNNGSAKVVLANKSQQLCDTFHFLQNSLSKIQTGINSEINSRIKETNTIIKNIASLNKQISAYEANGESHANELRDQRDGLEKRLKELLNVTVLKSGITTKDSQGAITTGYSQNYQVLLGGKPLINGDSYHKLVPISNGINTDIGIQNDDLSITDVTKNIANSSSETGALLGLRGTDFNNNGTPTNGDIGNILSSLDALSASLINNVNSIYSYSAQSNINAGQINEPVNIPQNLSNVSLNTLYSQKILKSPVKNGILQFNLLDNKGNNLTKTPFQVNIKPTDSINDVLNKINEKITNYDKDFDVKAVLQNGEIKFVPADTNNDGKTNPKGSVLISDDGSSLFNALNQIEYLPLNSIKDKLPLPLNNGSFDVVVYNNEGKELAKRTITIDSNSKNPKYSTIAGIVNQINTRLIDDNHDNNTNDDVDDYYHAQFINGHFIINSKTDTSTYIGLDNDTSNFGGTFQINNFFEGNNSKNIALKEELAKDPSKIHAYKAPNEGNNDVANEMLQLQFKEITFNKNNQNIKATLYGYYKQTTSNLADKINETNDKKDSAQTLFKNISNEYYSLSGVNIDDELIKLEKYQRGYQANTRVITTINKMLDALFSIR